MQRRGSIARQVSTRAVMTAVMEYGPISRAGISRATGLSKQTTSEIVRLLEETGWVEESGVTKGKVGRAAILYQVVPGAAYIIGVDLGGTKLRAALADMTGHLVVEEGVDTDRRGGLHVTAQIKALCARLIRRAGAHRDRVHLAVVGMPGVVNPTTGFVEFAPNIPGFDRIRVRETLSSEMGVEVHVENDVNLAVLGERWRGAGQGVDDLVFIALGTGLGQGIVLGGKLLHGATNAAGEIGYLPLICDPFTEQARTVGAFESAVGSRAILQMYEQKGKTCESVRALFERAGSGDTSAIQVLDELASRLALGVAATCALIDPAKVIFGGSVGGRADLVERIRHRLPDCMRKPPPVEASGLDSRAGVVGALARGLEELHEHTRGPGPIATRASSSAPATSQVRSNV